VLAGLSVRRSARGAALLDLIFACGLLVVIAAIAIPSVQAARDRDSARVAARHLATKLNLLRLDAIRRNRAVAVRFDPEEPGRFEVFADGDGDGVLQQDVDSLVDLPLEPPAHIGQMFAPVTFAVPLTMPAPDGNGLVLAGSDPVRIGSSAFLSFSPLGSATSGTLYLAGRAGAPACVRVLGPTGRVRVLWFDRASGAWRAD
jgi:type II secretory pathway pseudopilin PulG